MTNITGTFDAGFKTALLAKDVRLFLENAKKAGTPNTIGAKISDVWDQCEVALPESDITRVFEFINRES